ncbi:hypothetical protein EDD11_003369 [Mortierella claussenii]|nr:hypothetical protein EDD11_003369 [Mortierella claussenii]
MLRANDMGVISAQALPAKKIESPTDILARIWPEFDPHGHGIIAEMMEKVLRRVEQEQGTSLLESSSWDELADYIAHVEGTIVSQRDLSDLLSLLQGTSPPSSTLPTEQATSHDLEDIQSPDCHPPAYQQPEGQEQHYLATHNSHVNGNRDAQEERGYFQDEPRRPAFSASVATAIVQQHPHPRHHSSIRSRPRGNSANIRKISLSESSSFRPRHSKSSHGSSSEEESNESERRTLSPGPGSQGSHSSSSSPTPMTGDSKIWRSNYNNMSIREQSRTEYEGYGVDADYDTPENIESDHHKFLILQRKLKETERELEYQTRANELAKEAMMDQTETEGLKRDLNRMRREISEFKKNEQFKSAQIAELTMQIEKGEKTSSTQKSTAAALKKQKEELEEENTRIRESWRQSEDAYNQLTSRLAADEAERRKINADQQAIEELREMLAKEVAKGEDMARQLELISNEKLRLAESYGNLKNEVEALAGGATIDNMSLNLGADDRGGSLMSELAKADPKFGPGIENIEGDYSAGGKHEYNNVSPQRSMRQIQEISSLNRELKQKRSSRDISQRYKEGRLESALKNEVKSEEQPYTPSSDAGVENRVGKGGEQPFNRDTTAMVKHRADDVDCALPPEVQILEAKEASLNQALETQQDLVEALLRIQEANAARFGADRAIRQNEPLAKLQKIERAHRRKPQQSRVLSSDEVIDLLNPGAMHSAPTAMVSGSEGGVVGAASTSRAVSKKDQNKMIANATLVSLYTVVVYVLGLITSVFLVDNAQSGGLDYGRYISYDAIQHGAAVDVNEEAGGFRVFELLFYWLQNQVWQGDAGYVPT